MIDGREGHLFNAHIQELKPDSATAVIFVEELGEKLVIVLHTLVLHFYAPQLYRQVLLRRVLAMGILSVCPPVCHNRWYTKPR